MSRQNLFNAPAGLAAWGNGHERHPAAAPSRAAEAAHATLGIWYVCCVPLAAGLAIGDQVTIAGLRYTGWLWLGLLGGGMLLLLMEWAAHCRWLLAAPWIAHAIGLGYVLLSVLWSDQITARTMQDAVQMATPLLTAVAAATFIRTQEHLRLLRWSFYATTGLLALGVVATHLGWIRSEEQQGDRALALTAVMIGCLALSEMPERVLFPLAVWGVCLVLCVVSGSRMAAAALVLLPLFHPRLRLGWRLVAGVGALAAGYGAFHMPSLQQRFFVSGHGTLADLLRGDFLDFGRFDAWPSVWLKAGRAPFFGHGVGSAFDFVPTVWPEMHHVHNDYLRVYFELGAVGLVLAGVALAWQALDLRRWMNRTEGLTRAFFAAGLLGLWAVLLSALTDNPLVYNLWVTNLLGALVGAAYGAAAVSRPAIGGGTLRRIARREGPR